MARRLKDSQKRDLLEGYRSGESTTSLAQEYGCSQNTVIRTVKALLSSDEYNSLKASRSKGSLVGGQELKGSSSFINQNQSLSDRKIVQRVKFKKNISDNNVELMSPGEAEFPLCNDPQHSSPIEIDSIDDFTQDSNEEPTLGTKSVDNTSLNLFHEVVPLISDIGVVACKEVVCEKLKPGVLPGVVYMLVDRSVELDARPLKEFPELGVLPEMEQEQKALCLFSNQRSAKRNCGRNQRVIKVPDTDVFEISSRFLLARGITRLVLEGSLIALDAGTSASAI